MDVLSRNLIRFSHVISLLRFGKVFSLECYFARILKGVIISCHIFFDFARLFMCALFFTILKSLSCECYFLGFRGFLKVFSFKCYFPRTSLGCLIFLYLGPKAMPWSKKA